MIPSSHAIDNIKSKVEMQLYHRSNANKILIISVLINVNDENTVSSDFFEMFLNHLPSSKEVEKIIVMKGKNWNIFYGLPKDKNFYSYNGSILYVPCDDDVQWIIMEKRVSMSELIFEKLKMVNKSEHRNLKKLYNRKVFHTENERDFNIKISYYKKEKIPQPKLDENEDDESEYTYTVYAIIIIVLLIGGYFLYKKLSSNSNQTNFIPEEILQ